MQELMPEQVLMEAPYNITQENLDTYLPIDANIIREKLDANMPKEAITKEVVLKIGESWKMNTEKFKKN